MEIKAIDSDVAEVFADESAFNEALRPLIRVARRDIAGIVVMSVILPGLALAAPRTEDRTRDTVITDWLTSSANRDFG